MLYHVLTWHYIPLQLHVVIHHVIEYNELEPRAPGPLSTLDPSLGSGPGQSRPGGNQLPHCVQLEHMLLSLLHGRSGGCCSGNGGGEGLESASKSMVPGAVLAGGALRDG